MTEKVVRIENWSVVPLDGDGYIPPEAGTPCLSGNVFGHPHFNDGKRVSTSAIIGRDEKEEVIICGSRRYKLGAVDPDYEREFPDAKRKLLKSLPGEQNQESGPKEEKK